MISLTSLAVFAPLVLFWQQSKNFVVSALSFAIKNETIDFYSVLSSDFIDFLIKNSKQINFGNISYSEYIAFSQEKKKYVYPFLEKRTRFFFLYKKRIPLIVNATSSSKVSITYCALSDIKKLICEFEAHASDKTGKRQNKRFYITEQKGSRQNFNELRASSSQSNSTNAPTASSPASSGYIPQCNFNALSATPPINYSIDDLADCQPKNKNISKFYFCKESLKILEDVKNWKNKQDWYVSRDIVWRRGCLIHGKAGTGKSSTVLEVAKEVDLPIYIFDLSTMTNEDFDSKITGYIPQDGAIVLIEDIDNIFDGRENKHKTLNWPGISFDYFINKISGIKSCPNVYLFITTNHIEKLDSALIRPGRIDSIIEIGNLTREGKEFVASRILEGWPELIKEVVDDTEYTAAEFENICIQLALKMAWNQKEEIN